MSIDYSLYGGAETPFPPSPLPTPALSNDFTSSSSSSSEGEGEGEDTPLPRQHQTSKSQDYFTLRKRPSNNSKDDGDKALAGGIGIGMEKIPRVASPNVKDPEDFLWIMTEEPHRSRRKAILKAHPEVRKLMGHTPYTFPLVLLVLSLQLLTAFSLSTTHPLSLKFLSLAYALGGTANQNIFLAIHEITHNLAFKRILPNKLLAMLANVAIGVPYAMAFKGYHIEHHKYLGEDGIDTDLPSKLEAIVLNNVAGKTFFATFQIFFYALRPGFIRSQKPTLYHLLNLIVILSADYLIVHFGSWNSLLYLLFSSFFAGSLHPCAGHFIAEHYLMNEVASKQEGEDPAGKEGEMDLIRSLSQETTSYYGPLNLLCYNVGYHNEHHDFPSIPWTRLPKLREMAKEFYDPLPVHSSWCKVTWKFICDERVGMWSRAKRVAGDKGERIQEEDWKVCLKADEKVVNSMHKKQVKLVQDDVKVVGVEVDVNAEEDVELEKMMDEAVERGYGSDKEEKRTRRSGRARK